jgi:predicted nucleic-acid-binding Zn-ribbon protein
VKSETENKLVYTQDHTGDFSLVKYYRQLSAIFDLKQDNFYTIEIKDSSNNIIYRDKIFCTNQTILDYSVNNGNYVTHSSNNEFIII